MQNSLYIYTRPVTFNNCNEPILSDPYDGTLGQTLKNSFIKAGKVQIICNIFTPNEKLLPLQKVSISLKTILSFFVFFQIQNGADLVLSVNSNIRWNK